MTNQQLIEVKNNISKTGFVLENKVVGKLKKNNWNILNNRYYIDDVQGSAREIDILAFKSKEINNIIYTTAILISCKKSETNDWAFLTRKHNKLDSTIRRNIPVYWTSDEHIEFMLRQQNIMTLVNSKIEESNFKKLFDKKKNAFAFQEVKKTNGTVQNDKPIFESIISLVKALEYELKILDKKKNIKSFYNFNLLSVADTGFIELQFSLQNNIASKEIHQLNYYNRFILWGEEKYHKITFTTFTNLDNIIISYNSLHKWNTLFYSKLQKKFFEELHCNKDYLKYQLNTSIRFLLSKTKHYFSGIVGRDITTNDFLEILFKEEGKLIIQTRFETTKTEQINYDGYIAENTKKWLGQYFAYEGKFEFNDIFNQISNLD